MKQTIYILLIAITATMCRPDTQPVVENTDQFADKRTTVLYTIKAGNHFSEQNLPQVMNRNSMSATITFDSSAIYTSTISGNQADVNKLIGFSDCGNDHQQNSARIGWSWTDNRLFLYAYSYVDKVRIIKTLGSFELNKPISCAVKAEHKYYYFKANNFTDSIARYCTDYTGSRYKLFPYFGGDEVAPHEVHILVAED